MKYIRKTRHVFMVVGVLAVLALAMGWMTPASTVEAGPKAFNLPRVYNYSFGATQTGSWFATMHKNGEVNTDQISLNFDTKATTTLNLGPGHGTWKYNANNNKVIITTVHADRDGSDKYWIIAQTTTPDNDMNLTGNAKIFQYAAFGDLEPESLFQALCTNEQVKTAKFEF